MKTTIKIASVLFLFLWASSPAESRDIATRIIPRTYSPAASSECGPVSGRTLVDVCKKYTTETGKVGCFEAGKNARLDQCALGFCDTYHSEDGCTRCIIAIKNKTYKTDEIMDCNQFTDEEVATTCMEASGTPIR